MSSGKKKKIAFGMGIGVLFGMLIFPPWAYAGSPRQAVREGNLLYKRGEYDQSAQKYQEALEKDTESDIINFDMGTALHKQGRHQEAFDHLQKALLSDDDTLKEQAHYNLGNTFYHWGIAQENENIEGAISSLQNALKQYEDALSLKKDDDDALHNQEFVKKELERLLKKQEQSHQDQQNQKQEGKKDSSPQDNQRNDQQTPQQKQDQIGQPENQQEQSGGQGEDQSSESNGSPSGNLRDERKDQDSSAKLESSDQQELTESEAQKMLESYQQTEEPKGLLKVFQGHADTAPVLKDW